MGKANSYQYWSQQEINFLKSHYLKFNTQNIAKALNRSYSSVKAKIEKLKLYSQAIRANKLTTKLSETERAYIAGFIDGEGTIGISLVYRNGLPIHGTPVVSISNTNKRVLEWIASKVNRAKWIKKSVHVYKQPEYNPRHRDFYALNLCSRLRLEPFLKAILPYLQIKRKLAQTVLEFYEARIFQRPYSIQDWKRILKIRELTNSSRFPQIKRRKFLAHFIKELEKKGKLNEHSD